MLNIIALEIGTQILDKRDRDSRFAALLLRSRVRHEILNSHVQAKARHSRQVLMTWKNSHLNAWTYFWIWLAFWYVETICWANLHHPHLPVLNASLRSAWILCVWYILLRNDEGLYYYFPPDFSNRDTNPRPAVQYLRDNGFWSWFNHNIPRISNLPEAFSIK